MIHSKFCNLTVIVFEIHPYSSTILPLVLNKNLVLCEISSQGGGWCNTIRNCVYRKTTRRGSLNYMEKQLAFTGILSNKAEENPGLLSELVNDISLTYIHMFFCYPLFIPDTSFLCADFFNWNRVKLRYCDGASFAGDSENKVCSNMFKFSPFSLLIDFLQGSLCSYKLEQSLASILRCGFFYIAFLFCSAKQA